MPLSFQGIRGSTLVECPKGKYCENKCGQKVLFSLGDQVSNKCKYFEPSELALNARDTFKLDMVDWIGGSGHIVNGVAEGKGIHVNRATKHLLKKLRSSSQLS